LDGTPFAHIKQISIMPEGPSILILKEILLPFKGKKILEADGYAEIDMESLIGQKVIDLKTWGKHTLICLEKVTIRIHLMMFGSYSIDEPKANRNPKLVLTFANGSVYFYVCLVKLIEEDLDEVYDWEADIMSDKWSAAKAKKKLKEINQSFICDALMDQSIFSGVGNIIKNEGLFLARLHPESIIGNIPAKKINELINNTRDYTFDFLKWKKADELKKHWLAYSKKTCPRCNIPFHKKYTGKTKRRTFYCENCQEKY